MSSVTFDSAVANALQREVAVRRRRYLKLAAWGAVAIAALWYSAIQIKLSPIALVRGVGYMWGIDVMGTAAHVVSEAMSAGLLVCGAGEYTVRILPPLVATRDELSQGIGILEQVL